ncbi:MAG: hypothetical protein RMK75_00140 [Aquificaceae bacterium]|nr:hypothetical protein [Aquificaceae bacterium]MDW8422721.1 hypothetical protein [Aquificaceae bacterium]
MVIILLLTAFLSLALSKDFCVGNIQNPYPDPYVEYVFRKTLERALLESGHRIKCTPEAEKITPSVDLIKETPIAYTPQQRVSAYNLEIRVSLTLKEKRVFSALVSYSLPDGSLGDLPRRSAIQDAFNIIYTEMLQFLGRR